MKIKLWKVLFCCCIWAYLPTQAQDLHFTNYKFAPLYLNPANTGSFLGSYRLSGIARDQSRWITNPYQSQFLSVDTPLAIGLKDQHWVGLGLSVYNDQAGDIGMVNTGILLSAAYHWAFDKKYETVLTLGAQYGTIQRKSNNPTGASFGDDAFTSSMSGDFNLINNFNTSYSDVNFGLLLTKKLSKTNTWKLGAAVYHAINKGFQFEGGLFMNEVDPRINVHTSLRTQLRPQFILEPVIYFSSSAKARDIALQVNSEYLFNKKKSDALFFGLGYRLGDALQILAGGRYRKWELGLAYDMTISSAAAYNNSFGGVEIGLSRIFTVFKKPEVEPSILCPRF